MNNVRECFQVDNTQKKTNYHLYSISLRDCMRLLRDSSELKFAYFNKILIINNQYVFPKGIINNTNDIDSKH